jgi:DNA polymerase-3 subunit epsilon
MREIVLDTETTGFDPLQGHRIVEIGCVEVINYIATENRFHRYVNPERDMPAEAFAVHGLSEDFLSKHPVFAEQVDDFLEFIGGSRLVIHNAEFDMRFINAELTRLGRKTLPMDRALDTVQVARRKFPGAPASLDALCRRFGIDNSNRTLHGALLDAQLLAEVYLELQGGRQPDLVLANTRRMAAQSVDVVRIRRDPRPHAPTEEELVAHAALLKQLKKPVWLADEVAEKA